jgi:hypothetical protein
VKVLGRIAIVGMIIALAHCEGRPVQEPPKVTQPPCGRYQIVSGSVASPETGRPIAVILRIDTETGNTWYWSPDSAISQNGWLPASDPLK